MSEYQPEHTIEIAKQETHSVSSSIRVMYDGEYVMDIHITDLLSGPKFPAMLTVYTDPNRNPFLMVNLPNKIRKEG